MSIFEDILGERGVRMVEADRDARNANARKPWRVMGLSLGKPTVESEHDTEQQARAALAAIHRTCAPFIRDSFWVERALGEDR